METEKIIKKVDLVKKKHLEGDPFPKIDEELLSSLGVGSFFSVTFKDGIVKETFWVKIESVIESGVYLCSVQNDLGRKDLHNLDFEDLIKVSLDEITHIPHPNEIRLIHPGTTTTDFDILIPPLGNWTIAELEKLLDGEFANFQIYEAVILVKKNPGTELNFGAMNILKSTYNAIGIIPGPVIIMKFETWEEVIK